MVNHNGWISARASRASERIFVAAIALSAVLVSLLMPLALATPAAGACRWTGGDGSWFDEEKWTLASCTGVPTATDLVEIIIVNSHPIISGRDAYSAHLRLGVGNVTIENGGKLTSNASVHSVATDEGSSATMRITGADSAWHAIVTNEELGIRVGENAYGTLIVERGGRLSVSGDGNRLILGENRNAQKTIRGYGRLIIGAVDSDPPSAPGFVDVDEIEMGRGNDLGRAGASGLIQFNHTDEEYTFSPVVFGVGSIRQQAGTTILTGTNTYTGSTIVDGGVLRAGSEDSFVQNGAYIVNGGELQLNGFDLTMSSLSGDGGSVWLGRVPRANGGVVTLTVDQDRNTTYRGSIRGSANPLDREMVTFVKDGDGTLTLTGESALSTFSNNSGIKVEGGELVLSEVGTMRAHWLIVGKDDQDATLRVVGSGSEYRGATSVQVGSVGGQAVIFVEDGGLLTSASFAEIGSSAGSTGSVIVSGGSRWEHTGLNFLLGGNGTGALMVVSGGEVVSRSSEIGSQLGAQGTATVDGDGSKWLTSDNMLVGNYGIGYLHITDGGRVEVGTGGPRRHAVLGNNQRSEGYGTVLGSGSLLQADWVVVADEGTGELLVADGGKVDAYEVFIGRNTASTGILRIGQGGAAGELSAFDGVTFGPGRGVLEFNHTDEDYAFGARLISGSGGQGEIRHLRGTTRLTGASSGFTGETEIAGGTLLVDGSLGGTMTVGSGGVLGGSGTVGTTTVQNGGGISAGNSVGILTIDGDLLLSAGSFLDFELGSQGTVDDPSSGRSDRIVVTGDVTLDGTVNLSQSSDAADGTAAFGYYRLMTYGGSLTDNGLAIGDAPDVDGGGHRLLMGDGQVDLFVAALGDDELQHWQGGDGVWSTTAERWLNRDGEIGVAWAGNHAVFRHEPGNFDGGVITVDGTHRFRGLQFVDDGYELVGAGALETDAGGSELRVLAESAHIATTITGAGGIVKTEDGTLALSGTNTFTGGTTIAGGVLQVERDANLGDAAGGLIFAGGGLRVTDTMTSDRDVTLARDVTIDVVHSGGSVPEELTLGGVISGAGALRKTGRGELILSNDDNTFSGGIVVSAGRLLVTGTGALGTGSVIVDGVESELDLDGDRVSAGSRSIEVKNSARASFREGADSGDSRVSIDASSRVVIHGQEGGARATFANAGNLIFAGDGSAGDATIVNRGDLAFIFGADADRAFIVNEASGTVIFLGNADARDATIVNDEGAVVDMSNADTGVSIGSLSGAGAVRLGANVLTVGGLGLDDTFGGAITDGGLGGSLVKIGAGTLTLTGDHGYTGTTEIRDGRLQVDGSLIGSVLVHSDAAFGGSGTVGTTTVEAGGVLSPGNSMGTLTVDGDLTMKSGSKYEVEVSAEGNIEGNGEGNSADSASDLMFVTGAATLEGGSVIHIGANGTYDPLSTYRILKAEGGLTGEFDDVTSNFAFLTPTLVYNDAEYAVDLTLARNDIRLEEMASTHNQSGAASGVDSLGVGHPVYDAVVTLPDDGTIIGDALDSLSGEVHASVQGSMLSGGNAFQSIIVGQTQRFSSGLGANPLVTGATAAGPTGAIGAAALGQMGATSARGATGDAQVVFDWVQLVTDHGTTRGDGNAATLERSATGFAVGADTLLANGWTLGLGFGYTRSSFDIADRASTASSDDYHVGVYAGTDLGKANLRSGLSHTSHSVLTTRNVSVGALSETLEATYGTGTTEAFAELGYGLETKSMSFEPFVHVAHAIVSTDSFHEQGGSAALTAAAQRTDLTSATLGVRAASAFTVGNVNVTAGGTVGWTHALGGVRASSTHSFAGGRDFAVFGVSTVGDTAHAEVGLEVDLNGGVSLGLGYKGRFTSDTPDQGLQATLGVRF